LDGDRISLGDEHPDIWGTMPRIARRPYVTHFLNLDNLSEYCNADGTSI
jgi:hypothetical protein